MAKTLKLGTPIDGGFAFEDGHVTMDPRASLNDAHDMATHATGKPMSYAGRDTHGWHLFEPKAD